MADENATGGAQWTKVVADLAVVMDRTSSMTAQLTGITERLEKLDARFVSRSEHEKLSEDVKKIERNISWGVRVVIGIVLASATGLAAVKGIPH